MQVGFAEAQVQRSLITTLLLDLVQVARQLQVLFFLPLDGNDPLRNVLLGLGVPRRVAAKLSEHFI